jgi:hypothetical protein
VVPVFTVSAGGVKVKLLIEMVVGGSAASSTPAPSYTPVTAPSPAAVKIKRNIFAFL